MGLFSLFRAKDPLKIADELFTASMNIDVSQEERRWLPKLYVDDVWWIRERNLLRMGMTNSGIALAAGDHRRINAPRTKLADALNEKYKNYFMGVGNVTPDEGRHFYHCASRRYIVRPPEDMVLIFHHYLQNPGHWADRDLETSHPAFIPPGFQDFLHSIMRKSLANAIERAKELDA